MMKEFFQDFCPLEIGDTVAILTEEKGTLYYIPDRTKVVTDRQVHFHKVTDIMTQHYLKSHKTKFLLELDGSGKYEEYKIKIPVQQYAEAVDSGAAVVFFRKYK